MCAGERLLMFRAGVMCLTLGVILYIILLYIIYYIIHTHVYYILYITIIILYIISYTNTLPSLLFSHSFSSSVLFSSSSSSSFPLPILISSFPHPNLSSVPSLFFLIFQSSIPSSSSSPNLLFPSSHIHSKYTCRHLDILIYIPAIYLLIF